MLAGAVITPHATIGRRELADGEPRARGNQRARGDVPTLQPALVERVEAPQRAPGEVQRRGTRPAGCRARCGSTRATTSAWRAANPVVAESGGDHRHPEAVRAVPPLSIGAPFSVASPERVAANTSSRIGSSTTPAIVPAGVLASHADRERRDLVEVVDRPVERVDDPAQVAVSRGSPSSPRIASSGRRCASTDLIAFSAARSASDTRSVGPLFDRTPLWRRP